MTLGFEERKQQLHDKYCELTLEERRQLKERIKRKNVLLFFRLERMKHDLLRLEAKRAQLESEGKESELNQTEEKILVRKEEFLNIMLQVRNKMRRS